MGKLFEPLNGGIQTRTHAALLKEGQLVKAVDAEYRPDDPGLWVSPARARCGTVGVSGAPITALAPLVWDPGTTVDGTTPELRQVGFVDPTEPRVFQTVPTASSPTDSAWNTARQYILSDGGEASFGSRLDYAAFDNSYFLFPGSTENYVLERLGTGQRFSRHGMRENRLDLVVLQTGTVLVKAVEPGFYQYWITFYSSVLDREGDRPDPGHFLPGETYLNLRLVNSAAVVTTQAAGQPGFTLYVSQAAFDAARPPHADRIRIYRSVGYDGDVAVFGTPYRPLGIPWPLGWLITEVTINNFAGPGAPTVNLAAPYDTVGPVYPIFTDTFQIGDDVIDRHKNATKAFDSFVIEGVARGRNGPPPPASTGDTYERTIICNDLRDPRKIRWSAPDDPHAFPDLNLINMDSKESDEVRAVRTLGTRLFVGMAESIWKINWLPLEGDTDGASARTKDIVVEGKGCLGPEAVTRWALPRVVYVPDGTLYGTMIAWVSRDGVYATDLDNTIKLTRGIEWPLTNKAVLLDNPEKERLEVGIYTGERIGAAGAPAGVPDAWFYIQYSDGQIRVTGPVRKPGGIYAAALMRLAEGAYVLSTDMNSRFAIEGVGSVEPATGEAPELDAQTREIYPEGFMEETEIGRACCHASGAGTLKVQMSLDRRNSHDSHDKTLNLADPLNAWIVQKWCERLSFRIRATGDLRVNFVGASDFGQELGEIEQ